MGALLPANNESDFKQLLEMISVRRSRASQAVNNETLLSAWETGAFVSARLKTDAWGSKTVTQLAEYLRTQDPSLRGYGRRNLYNMVMFYESYSSRDFAEYAVRFSLPGEGKEIAQIAPASFVQSATAFPVTEIVQFETAQMPSLLHLTTFTNHVEILNRCKTTEERVFYILYACKERLNIKELRRCIQTEAFASLAGEKHGLSATLTKAYPKAPLLFKDELFVDFLALPARHSEKKLKHGILDNMKDFILEMGKDFLFIDSEYPLNVGGSTFKIDLLFFHRGLQCLVAIELKASKFTPRDLGQLEFYLEALDRDVKRSNENPSIGILLCKSADKSVVEYALSRSLSPTMVAEYKRQLIPKETLRKSLDEFSAFFEEDNSATRKGAT